MVLRILFLTLNKADIRFAERELVWRTYTATEALSMTKRIEIIDKKEFAVAALNIAKKTFIVHIAALAESTTMPIYPSCQVQVAALTSEGAGISAEYFDFSNVFSSDSTAELPKYTGINDHPIDLLDNK